MADEKTVKCFIPEKQNPEDSTVGFCWDGKDYFNGDAVVLPEAVALNYAANGKVVIGEKPSKKSNAPA